MILYADEIGGGIAKTFLDYIFGGFGESNLPVIHTINIQFGLSIVWRADK